MTEHPLLKSFQQFIQKNHLVNQKDKILITVSGGIDSMTLLDLFVKSKKILKLEIAVAHFNHQLRGRESDEDEAFVRSRVKDYGLTCYVDSADTKHISEIEKISIQEAARNLRYAFFTKLKSSINFQKIATAHNADDNAETILLNILRGSGIHGLTGIPLYNKDANIIRPLLFARRDSIRDYVEFNRIPFREDSSNLKNDYTRNFLRNKLFPLIKDNINPNYSAALARTSEIFNQLEEYIEKEIKTLSNKIITSKSEKEIHLNLIEFKNQPLFIQEYILLNTAREFTKSEVDFNAIKNLLYITKSETGACCYLTNNKIMYRDRNKLIFSNVEDNNPFTFTIDLLKKYEFDKFTFESAIADAPKMTKDRNIEYVDGDKISNRLIIRSWHEGDRFIPLGMKVEKKVSDFLIDQKIPLFKKNSIPILLSDDKIVWICGMRLDDRFKITEQTKKYIKLEYIPKL